MPRSSHPFNGTNCASRAVPRAFVRLPGPLRGILPERLLEAEVTSTTSAARNSTAFAVEPGAGVLAIFLVGWFGGEQGSLSLGTLVGFVTLFGITMRNSIMMVSHFEHLVNVEKLPWCMETALRGATERLVPILMTALVTALGLLPLALGSGEAGREIEGPMAIVILGGLVTSTALNLLVLPTLAFRYGKLDAK